MDDEREVVAFERERVKHLTVKGIKDDGTIEVEATYLRAWLFDSLVKELAAKLIEYEKVLLSTRALDGKIVWAVDLYVVVPGGAPPEILTLPLKNGD